LHHPVNRAPTGTKKSEKAQRAKAYGEISVKQPDPVRHRRKGLWEAVQIEPTGKKKIKDPSRKKKKHGVAAHDERRRQA